MLLGYNTNGLQNHRLDDALHLLADLGFQVVALTPDVGHLDPFQHSSMEVEAIAALLERLSLQVVIETGARYLLDPARKHEPTLMTRDAGERVRRLDFYGKAAALGRDLGAEVLSFWSGIDRTPGPDSLQRLDEGVSRTCEIVREVGLQPALEPEPGMAMETVADYRALRGRLGSAAPGLTLDVGHLYAVDEGEPLKVIAEAGPWLAQVHLEDMRWGEHVHREPGDGDVDFQTTLTVLQKTGYEGPVCFELSRSSHRAPEAIWYDGSGPIRHRVGWHEVAAVERFKKRNLSAYLNFLRAKYEAYSGAVQVESRPYYAMIDPSAPSISLVASSVLSQPERG